MFTDGKALTLEDYKSLKVFGARVKDLTTRSAEKGHKEELEAFADAIQKGDDWPIPLWQQLQAMEMALAVEGAIGKVQRHAA